MPLRYDLGRESDPTAGGESYRFSGLDCEGSWQAEPDGLGCEGRRERDFPLKNNRTSQHFSRAKVKGEKHTKYVLESLQYFPIYKIGLAIFGATKMWGHF